MSFLAGASALLSSSGAGQPDPASNTISGATNSGAVTFGGSVSGGSSAQQLTPLVLAAVVLFIVLRKL